MTLILCGLIIPLIPAAYASPAMTPDDVEVAEVPSVELDAAYVEALATWIRSGPDPMEEAEATEIATQMATFEATLPWQTGTIEVDNVAHLELSEGDRFVGTEGAAIILEQWGNPPNQQHAGMLLPNGAHLFGPDSWAVVVDYEDMGWVDDTDAATIDYDELLSEMQADTREGAKARRELGLEGLELVGWAEPPHYDPATHVLYWARSLRADGGDESLNYEVRVLGRGGVLSLNAVADIGALARVRTAMEPVRMSAAFVSGQTYADYEPGVDPTAGVGVAALIAGGALAASKGGLFKGLFALLMAGKKFIVIAVVAVGAFFARMFGGGRSSED